MKGRWQSIHVYHYGFHNGLSHCSVWCTIHNSVYKHLYCAQMCLLGFKVKYVWCNKKTFIFLQIKSNNYTILESLECISSLYKVFCPSANDVQFLQPKIPFSFIPVRVIVTDYDNCVIRYHTLKIYQCNSKILLLLNLKVWFSHLYSYEYVPEWMGQECVE